MIRKSIYSDATIENWLRESTALLKGVGIESARLDAEILLAHTLKVPRIYLHSHSDDRLDERDRDIANARIDLRRDFTPIAYIIGHKEFYGRRFIVTTSTLIPRPESEAFITLLKDELSQTNPLIDLNKRLVDVGTGSGCLGITAKLEFPEYTVTLTDTSNRALTVAKRNASTLKAEVEVEKRDLLRGFALPIDVLIANLPYVDREWDVSRETRSEPQDALFAGNGGLALINLLLIQAEPLVVSDGLLLLESDPRQHESIIATAKQHSFAYVGTEGFVQLFKRNTR